MIKEKFIPIQSGEIKIHFEPTDNNTKIRCLICNKRFMNQSTGTNPNIYHHLKQHSDEEKIEMLIEYQTIQHKEKKERRILYFL